MPKDSHVPPLTRRVPGATNWPTPVTRATPPALPESVLQRMRVVTEAETAGAEAETAGAEAETAGAEAETAGAEAETADAVTAPIPVVSGPASSNLASPAIDKTTAPSRTDKPNRTARPKPDRPARPKPDRTAKPDRTVRAPAAHKTAAAIRAPQLHQAREQERARPATTRRRYRVAPALVAALGIVAVGSLAFVLSRHTARVTGRDDAAAKAAALRAEVAGLNHAATWIAGHVSHTARVSCDQAMCRALVAHGIPAADLLELQPRTVNPLGSEVIVATQAVRNQFGNVLSSVYAPAVIASWGTGHLLIEVRVIAPHGATAYFTALRQDLAQRKKFATILIDSRQILVTGPARRKLSAGQVDSRLMVTIADMAARHQLRIVAFGDSGPGASASSPLRSADLAEANATPGEGSSAYVQSMLAFLHASAPYPDPHASAVRLAEDQTILRVEFAAPSPLGLLASRSS
jgi:hypothetical protein